VKVRVLFPKTWADVRGTAAVEFAVVEHAFIMIVLDTLYLCLCMFLTGSLHYAVSQVARCASVKITVRTTSS